MGASALAWVPGAGDCVSVYVSEITQLPGGSVIPKASLGFFFYYNFSYAWLSGNIRDVVG